MHFVRYLPFILLPVFVQGLNVTTQNNPNVVNSTYQGNLPLTFKPHDYFAALEENCKRIAEQLETCPKNLRNSSKSRFDIAQAYSECLAKQYGDHFACSKPFNSLKYLPVEAFPAMYRTQTNDTKRWSNVTLPAFSVNNGTCKLPSVVTIMQKACVFDYQSIENSTCCGNGPNRKEPCGKLSFNLLACSMQSVRTYVGCTAKEADDVENCVVNTAKRINFVPIGFQVDSNGNKCLTPNETIFSLARVIVVDFLVFVFINNPAYWYRIFQRFVLRKDVKIRTRTFRVSNLAFWTTIAADISENVVLVGVVLSRQGYQIDMLKNFVLFSVRPRGAFFHALLGYIDGGWAHDGLIDMIAQVLLSIFGGYMALFGAISANHTLDPSRPLWWKTYLAGGAMASIVTDFLWLYVSAIGISLALICCGGLVALAYLVTIPAVLGWMMLIVGPFKEIKIMLQNIYNLIRRRERCQNPDSLLDFRNLWLSRWYKITMFVSLVLFIGCWMFWNGFLRLSGELYCPQDQSRIDLTMIGFYVASVLKTARAPSATGFDLWYAYAKKDNVILVEEIWDQIYEDLTPFWSMDPLVLRKHSASPADKHTLHFRNGKLMLGTNQLWLDMWKPMLKDIASDIPDLDMAFNTRDEPKVIVHWETLEAARGKGQPPSELADMSMIFQTYTGRYPKVEDIQYASKLEFISDDEHAIPMWAVFQAACPPDSPARSSRHHIDLTWEPPLLMAVQQPPPYSFDVFVSDWKAVTNPCYHPHLGGLHTTFVRPLRKATTNQLIPFFSSSKHVGNSDILFPGAMYYGNWGDFHTPLDSINHTDWDENESAIGWRGTTSGGVNTEGNGFRFQRHRFSPWSTQQQSRTQKNAHSQIHALNSILDKLETRSAIPTTSSIRTTHHLQPSTSLLPARCL
ncbi:glycosyltransferase family 90 protein [Zopfia rhizophila CBS 207.26]|uniref:Glycosyltransferase family 90 protein n=1 Tax=Zopfia rhizophila CBS 207.26 TaxID=1314779 RepID=A0A6A6EUL5_9PEZI|nr:glycosyltransferase family 90 protein [Zopfia rhizophila CBS 207.26]